MMMDLFRRWGWGLLELLVDIEEKFWSHHLDTPDNGVDLLASEGGRHFRVRTPRLDLSVNGVRALEVKVLVTERIRPVRLRGVLYRAVHLLGIILDANTHIQEDKVSTPDIRPGRRPRGPELFEFVEDYRWRAGVESGRAGVNGRAPDEDPSAIQSTGVSGSFPVRAKMYSYRGRRGDYPDCAGGPGPLYPAQYLLAGADPVYLEGLQIGRNDSTSLLAKEDSPIATLGAATPDR
ncbi:hypothetical protein B0I37DRAFT_348686 [Chaetomium sp. MPI-CAGE-AT-0009]|nr:hypothetical protein B0I37DRAFT_348686 [Chaetomium sp. MPI-CAGE-AT-0009]